MRCEQVQRALRSDEALSGELAEHLAGCESCRASWAADEALVAELRELPNAEPPSGHPRSFRRGVEARLRAETRPAAPSRNVAPVGLAAAAALLVLLGAVALLPLSEGTGAGAPPEAPMALLSPEDLTPGDLIRLEEAALTLAPASGEEIGAQVWATALGGETEWIGELSDEEQRALLEALDEDLG
jgi:hypothetical protein